MRSRSRSKENRICEIDPLLPIDHPLELRKNEGPNLSSKARSKCSSVKEHSRSGGTTPRCLSESPKLGGTPATDTPRNYLIKDFLGEADSKLLEQCQSEIVPHSPVPNASRFLSEIDEVEWSYDGARLVDNTSLDEDPDRFRDELRKLRGKAKAQIDNLGQDKRGKAPLAFPTEEEQGKYSSQDSRGKYSSQDSRGKYSSEDSRGTEDSEVLPLEKLRDSGSNVPAWFSDAYNSLAQLDDFDSKFPDNSVQAEKKQEDPCSSSQVLMQKPDGFYAQDLASSQGKDKDSDETSTSGDRVRNVIFGDGDSEENKEVEEEQVERGQQGPGWLWKVSLCASVSFVTWVLANGAKIQCRSLLPTVREREQPVKIFRRKNSMIKFHEAEDSRPH